MSFGYIQGNWFHIEVGSPQTSIGVTLPSTPTPGNLLVCVVAVTEFDGVTADTITALKDSNNVSLAYVPSSVNPAPYWTNVGQLWLAYYKVPVTPSKTFTATVSMSSNCVSAIWVDEFSFTGNTPAKHLDAAQGNLTSTGAVLSAPPSIPVVAGDMIYSACICDSGFATSPTVNSPWTLAGNLPIGGANAFQAGSYILAPSAGTSAMSYNDVGSAGDSYGAIIATFNQPNPSVQGYGACINDEMHWGGN